MIKWIQREVHYKAVADTLRELEVDYNIIEWQIAPVGDATILIVASVADKDPDTVSMDQLVRGEALFQLTGSN